MLNLGYVYRCMAQVVKTVLDVETCPTMLRKIVSNLKYIAFCLAIFVTGQLLPENFPSVTLMTLILEHTLL